MEQVVDAIVVGRQSDVLFALVFVERIQSKGSREELREVHAQYTPPAHDFRVLALNPKAMTSPLLPCGLLALSACPLRKLLPLLDPAGTIVAHTHFRAFVTRPPVAVTAIFQQRRPCSTPNAASEAILE